MQIHFKENSVFVSLKHVLICHGNLYPGTYKLRENKHCITTFIHLGNVCNINSIQTVCSVTEATAQRSCEYKAAVNLKHLVCHNCSSHYLFLLLFFFSCISILLYSVSHSNNNWRHWPVWKTAGGRREGLKRNLIAFRHS